MVDDEGEADDGFGTTCAGFRLAEFLLVIDLPDAAANSLDIGANAETTGSAARMHAAAAAAAPRAPPPLVLLLAFVPGVEVAAGDAGAAGGANVMYVCLLSHTKSSKRPDAMGKQGQCKGATDILVAALQSFVQDDMLQ